MSEAAILWKRLDGEGHDCCRIRHVADGWSAQGVAAFLHDGMPASLRYTFSCDARWRTRQATVAGWIGDKQVNLRIDRSETGIWRLDDVEQALSPDIVDIDLGFTPATNILPVRRLALSPGDESPAPAAYLDVPAVRLDVIEQVYRRIDAVRYDYRAPGFGYRGTLEVSPTGFVASYPRLFEAVGYSAT